MAKNLNFTEGPILPGLIKFALPVLAASLLQMAYGAVDLLIVGHFGDASSVSAVGSGSEVMFLVTCIIMGLTMGSTVLIGQRIGSKDPGGAGKAIGASISLFIIVAIVLSIIMQIFAVPLSKLMQTPEEAFDKTVTYVRICSAGIIFITGYNVITGIFRGLGNSTLPMIFVAISAVTNVIGDYILCGPLGMDVAGAAIATIASQALSVVLSFIIIRHQDLPFKFKKRYITLAGDNIKRILRLGAPLALQDALVQSSFIIVNAFANSLGLYASAGYGVGNRIMGFLMLVPIAVSQSVTAVVSQNVGAGLYKRAKKALFETMGAGVGLGLAIFALGLLFTPQIASVFTDEAPVVDQAVLLIRGFLADCILTNMLFAFSGFFNGHGHTTEVMIQGLTSALLLRVPLSWIFSTMPAGNLFRLGLATPISTIYGIIFYTLCYRKMKKKHPELL